MSQHFQMERKIKISMIIVVVHVIWSKQIRAMGGTKVAFLVMIASVDVAALPRGAEAAAAAVAAAVRAWATFAAVFVK